MSTRNEAQTAIKEAQAKAQRLGRAYNIYTYIGYRDMRFYHLIPAYMSEPNEDAELYATVDMDGSVQIIPHP